MDLFHNAKCVRLRGHHQNKYLIADDDEETVTQDRTGSSKSARWTVEFIPNSPTIIRLKSCYGKYLTASNLPFLLGMTGRKVLQTRPSRPDSSVEWEPVKEGGQVKLRTRYGQFLRANGGLPPWRNSVTHDVPHRTATQDWILWDVDIVAIQEKSPVVQSPIVKSPARDFVHSDSSGSAGSRIISRQESIDSPDSPIRRPPPKAEGRTIYYQIVSEDGEVNESKEEYSFIFKGKSVGELTETLKEETGLEDIILCTISSLNQKLYPLRLQLPPNNADMHVVVVPSSSKVASELA